jgi:hypothetical protein
MKFGERIIGMFTRPDDTTKDIANEPRIEEGLLIVGIYMVLLILGTYLTLSRIKYTGEIQGIGASAVATIALIPPSSWPSSKLWSDGPYSQVSYISFPCSSAAQGNYTLI